MSTRIRFSSGMLHALLRLVLRLENLASMFRFRPYLIGMLPS